MNDHLLAAVFILVSLVLGVGLLFTAQERNHWKHSYESLRNGMLAEGQRESKRIIGKLQDEVARALTLDEMIDSQG